VPEARWVLAGARPPRAVRRLAALPGVEVHPDVPDLDPYLAAATVAVAPMPTGSGVPMKVLEAWAAGIPVVPARRRPRASSGARGRSGAGRELERVAVAALVRLLTEPPRPPSWGPGTGGVGAALRPGAGAAGDPVGGGGGGQPESGTPRPAR